MFVFSIVLGIVAIGALLFRGFCGKNEEGYTSSFVVSIIAGIVMVFYFLSLIALVPDGIHNRSHCSSFNSRDSQRDNSQVQCRNK